MELRTSEYSSQVQQWPSDGRHILAQFDAKNVIVYQAYRPQIGRYAADHGYFGGEFSLNRMSWIKPNFLWMMYRCGWAMKPDQETVLAISLRRVAFDEILARAVHSSFVPEIYTSFEDWKQALANSDVRLQWDPDHGPGGEPLPRRAIQLGLRGEILRQYAREWIVSIEDITEFVHEQRECLEQRGKQALVMPQEVVYPISTREVAARLQIDAHE